MAIITSNSSNNSNSNNSNTKSSGTFRNKSILSTDQTPSASSISLNPPNLNIEALKRKFQRVNQEIVKQNVSLHDQLARRRQEQHLVLQENVRLKGRLVALESKLREAEGVCLDTKKSIGDRIEILEVIGEHLLDVTKFLRLLSSDENTGKVVKSDDDFEDKENFNVNGSVSVNSKMKMTDKNNNTNKAIANSNKNNNHQNNHHNNNQLHLHPIVEEEDLAALTDHISDVSLKAADFEFEFGTLEPDNVEASKAKSQQAAESFKRKRH